MLLAKRVSRGTRKGCGHVSRTLWVASNHPGKNDTPATKFSWQSRCSGDSTHQLTPLPPVYVAYTGNDELHQLRKRARKVVPNYASNAESYDHINGFTGNAYSFGDKTGKLEGWKLGENDKPRPKHSRGRPFSLQMPFENDGQGNLEKHVTVPTSSQPLYFPTYLKAGETHTRDDATEQMGPYSTHVPFMLNHVGQAAQYENVISGLLKRYSEAADTSTVHCGCSGAGWSENGYTYPDSFQYKRSRGRVCGSEMNRVIIWDIDSTFGTVEIEPANAESPNGYRVERDSDEMIRLMHLHTGAPPKGKPQVSFPNYRPVRSMFDSSSWSAETMCFDDENDFVNVDGVNLATEQCARKACGSGKQWCEVDPNEDPALHEGNALKAPWQRLSRSGTSDGTFRNNVRRITPPRAHPPFLYSKDSPFSLP